VLSAVCAEGGLGCAGELLALLVHWSLGCFLLEVQKAVLGAQESCWLCCCALANVTILLRGAVRGAQAEQKDVQKCCTCALPEGAFLVVRGLFVDEGLVLGQDLLAGVQRVYCCTR
jgi:hypothetical protein